MHELPLVHSSEVEPSDADIQGLSDIPEPISSLEEEMHRKHDENFESGMSNITFKKGPNYDMEWEIINAVEFNRLTKGKTGMLTEGRVIMVSEREIKDLLQSFVDNPYVLSMVDLVKVFVASVMEVSKTKAFSQKLQEDLLGVRDVLIDLTDKCASVQEVVPMLYSYGITIWNLPNSIPRYF